VVRAAAAAGIVLCLADWVLIEDLGFLGGLGTDPNSMLPMILVFSSGYLALSPVLAAADSAGGRDSAGGGWRGWLRPERLREAAAMTSARTVTAAGSVALIVLGAAPMAATSVNRNADPVIAQAIAGNSAAVDLPAPAFRLADQNGREVTLAGLRGKVVLLTFLDPVCTTDCPLIAQEFKYAGTLLGAQDRQVELVAIAANPAYYSSRFTRAFTAQEGLNTVPNWEYLTGTLPELRQIWNQYGVTVQDLPAGAMSAHNDIAIVIDRYGAIRQELDADPGPGTTSTQSSWAALLAAGARQALGQR
jgi:cytochrome oxidase Cu insertion factor (SCO1/SenC/PrrC family)